MDTNAEMSSEFDLYSDDDTSQDEVALTENEARPEAVVPENDDLRGDHDAPPENSITPSVDSLSAVAPLLPGHGGDGSVSEELTIRATHEAYDIGSDSKHLSTE